MNFRALLSLLLTATTLQQTFSQSKPVSGSLSDQSFSNHNPTTGSLIGADNAITTAVPFLNISPDARHAALGDVGVATSPDANSAYWNAAKLVFIDKSHGASVSASPWLGKIINDMWIYYVSGFYKITREQALGIGMKYFDLGDISFRDANNFPLGDFNPREFAFDVTYSRMLSESFSVGLTGRYIFSNLTGAFSGFDAQAGHSAAADVGVYYTTPIKKSSKNSTLSLGAAITNIGAKISYTGGDRRDFIPVNLRLGSAFTTDLDPFNSLTFAVDFNKLLVPTPPIKENGTIVKGKDDNRSLLSGMFGSFSDAPGGAKEELQEVMISTGLEYWYHNSLGEPTFAGRLGYFNEAKNKGNRKYMTLGIGFRKNRFGIDLAYLVPTNKREHPLAETIRISLHFHVDSDRISEESVKD